MSQIPRSSLTTFQRPLLSTKIEDSDVFGVMAEVDPDDALRMGAFREDALTPEDAWESQADGEGAQDGE